MRLRIPFESKRISECRSDLRPLSRTEIPKMEQIGREWNEEWGRMEERATEVETEKKQTIEPKNEIPVKPVSESNLSLNAPRRTFTGSLRTRGEG